MKRSALYHHLSARRWRELSSFDFVPRMRGNAAEGAARKRGESIAMDRCLRSLCLCCLFKESMFLSKSDLIMLLFSQSTANVTIVDHFLHFSGSRLSEPSLWIWAFVSRYYVL